MMLPLKQYGAALVEFALVLPLFAFLIVAIFEMSNILKEDNTLSKAVRESVRYMARQGGSGSCNNNVATGIITTAVPLVTNINIDAICVDSNGTVTLPIDIKNQPVPQFVTNNVNSFLCNSSDYFNEFNPSDCSNSNLHIRVTASYNYNTKLIPGSSYAKYTPTLSAASIMMAP